MEANTSSETQILNLQFKFADKNNINMLVSVDESIGHVISKIILIRNSLENQYQTESVPETIYSKFKLVFKGKMWSNTEDKVSTILDIQNDSILHCIFPQLSSDDIELIKNNTKTPDENVRALLSSIDFYNILKNPGYFKLINEFITNPTIFQNRLNTENSSNESVAIPSSNSAMPSAPLNDYQNEISLLNSMGFGNNSQNMQLLSRYNGNIQSVIDEILN